MQTLAVAVACFGRAASRASSAGARRACSGSLKDFFGGHPVALRGTAWMTPVRSPGDPRRCTVPARSQWIPPPFEAYEGPGGSDASFRGIGRSIHVGRRSGRADVRDQLLIATAQQAKLFQLVQIAPDLPPGFTGKACDRVPDRCAPRLNVVSRAIACDGSRRTPDSRRGGCGPRPHHPHRSRLTSHCRPRCAMIALSESSLAMTSEGPPRTGRPLEFSGIPAPLRVRCEACGYRARGPVLGAPSSVRASLRLRWPSSDAALPVARRRRAT